MGVGADTYKGLFFMAWIGLIACGFAFCALLGFLLWLLYRGVMAAFGS